MRSVVSRYLTSQPAISQMEGFKAVANGSVAVLPDEDVAARVRRLEKPSRSDRGHSAGFRVGPRTNLRCCICLPRS